MASTTNPVHEDARAQHAAIAIYLPDERTNKEGHGVLGLFYETHACPSASRFGPEQHLRPSDYPTPASVTILTVVGGSQVRERPWYSQVSVRMTSGSCRVCSRECQEAFRRSM
jgi:hypothetical protein